MDETLKLGLRPDEKIPNVDGYKFEPIKGYPMLQWKGKRPFTGTQFFPAQLKENHGEEVSGWMNKIFWGDNLQVMSHLIKEYRGKVDLIYIDPPFDSKVDYKKKIDLKGNQLNNSYTGFEEKQYTDIWNNDEYLQFFYERIILIRELLSETGSIYVHCDWHKSHIIRCVLDEVFGNGGTDGKSAGYKNEIIWQRTDPHNDAKTRYGNIHDTIFFYTKSSSFTYNWADITVGLSAAALKEYLWMKLENGDIVKRTEELPEGARVFKLNDATQKGKNPNRIFEWRGVSLGPGYQWCATEEELEEMLVRKELFLPKYPMGAKRCKVGFLDTREEEGQVIQDIWQDAGRMKGGKGEYPTQKPNKLLERIILASSNPGDIVFDCFMGSGTTQVTAMSLGRKFIGADINLGALQITTKRLLNTAKDMAAKTHEHPIYSGFSVYNVNHYDVFRNPVEAKELLAKALEIQQLPNNSIYDGEKDGRMVKIMPVNRIATRADLNELISNFDYKRFEKSYEAAPNKPVEYLLIICMGHEADLAAELQREIPFKLDIEVVDILRDRANLEFKREAEAEVVIEEGYIVVRDFFPMNLMHKLSLMKDNFTDWKELVESVMIDFNYDGAVFEPKMVDVPSLSNMVAGSYKIPDGAGAIRVKITDLLSEAFEITIDNG